MIRTILKHRWFKRGLLLLVLVACVLGSRRPKLPGSLGAIAAEVRVGMSRDEVVALMHIHRGWRDRDDLTYVNIRGNTGDGRSFSGSGVDVLDNLPPADQIACCELWIDDDDGLVLNITFGPGGMVTALRLESRSICQELRYSLASGTGWRGWPRVTDRHQCFESVLRNL